MLERLAVRKVSISCCTQRTQTVTNTTVWPDGTQTERVGRSQPPVLTFRQDLNHTAKTTQKKLRDDSRDVPERPQPESWLKPIKHLWRDQKNENVSPRLVSIQAGRAWENLQRRMGTKHRQRCAMRIQEDRRPSPLPKVLHRSSEEQGQRDTGVHAGSSRRLEGPFIAPFLLHHQALINHFLCISRTSCQWSRLQTEFNFGKRMEDSFSALVALFFLLYDSSLARLNQKGVCA